MIGDQALIARRTPHRRIGGDRTFRAYVLQSISTNQGDPDYRVGAPEDWSWPAGRIDQWGLSDKDSAALGVAERKFRFKRIWTPASLAPPAGPGEQK